MSARFIHGVACVGMSVSSKPECCSVICAHHMSLIPSSGGGRVGRFRLLGVDTAVNMVSGLGVVHASSEASNRLARKGVDNGGICFKIQN